YNFGQIRIHADERAGLSAQALEAHAYTTGIDIVFGTGEYNPGTYEGDLLLAHELTHVIQQTAHQPFHESSELAQTSSLSEAGKMPTEMLRGPVIQRQQLDSSTTPTAPPVAGDTTGEQNPPVSSSLPPETLQQLAYAATVLRQVQPLPEEQTNRLNQIIADAPVYQMIKRRNEKRAQLEQDRQTLTDYQHRAEAVARGEELAGGVPASQDVMDHLTNEIADLSRETEQLDRDIQANLTRLGVNSEQELLQKIEVAFPEMWINRAKQIANTMLDENRMQVQRELARYPADASSTDIEGLRSADRHLNTLTIELRDLSQQIETKQSERTEKTRQLQSGQQLNSEVARGESLPGGVPPSGAELQALQGEVDRLDADIQALRTQIPVKEQALRAQQQAYGAQYPILLLPDYAPGAFVQATPEQLTQMTGSWLQKILDNIGTTRQNINEERLKVWQLRDVPGLTYQSLGVEEHSVFGDGVQAYTQNRQSEEEALHIAEAVFQVGAVVLASVVAGPLGGAIVGGLLTLNQLVEHIDQYNVESAASQVALNPVIADISANEPNLLPIVLDIIALGLDAGAVIGALRPAARILVATGDATQFANDARRVLPAETADQLVSKVTRRVASSASSDVAGTLTQAMRNDVPVPA
ncbi:MAG TPA: DUF4157 domain-containing protein, partial [Ktedonobacteraceae bacterium]|nr:DUF4157 domain-containing protein [Ktedonobacteraceae bacterium]